MSPFLSKILSALMPYIVGASFVAIGGLWFMLSLANNKYDNLVEDAATKIERAENNTKSFEGAVISLQETINELRWQANEEKIKRDFRDQSLASLQKELDEERQRNESYRTRWANVANKKPELLARIINRATAERVRRIAAATCRTDCGPDETNQDSGGTSTKTIPSKPE